MTIIIPYIHYAKTISNDLTCHTIRILCEGGRTFWNESIQSKSIDKEVKSILESNDIHSTTPFWRTNENKEIIFVEVNTKKTDMTSMYDWNECDYEDTETLCWRTFRVLINSDKTPWLSVSEEPFSKVINSIILKTIDSI